MTDFFEHWENQSQDNAKLVAQEVLITELTEAIWAAMEQSGVKKSELAKRMGATKGYVSQVLNGTRNMTLRTLSDICFALGRKPNFAIEVPPYTDQWHTVRTRGRAAQPSTVRYQRTGNVLFPTEHWQEAA